MWALLLAAVAAATTCPDAPVQAVQEATAGVEASFVTMNEEAFIDAAASLETALPCVRELLELRDVLAIHRSAAIVAFAESDMTATRKSWGAVRALNPSWTPPDALAPPDHLLRELFEEAVVNDDVIALERAPHGGWVVDGRAASAVPQDRAFVLQALGRDGEVLFTGYGRSVAEVPPIELVRPGPSARARKVRTITTVAGGVLAAGAAGAAALHFDARARLTDLAYDKVAATTTRGNVAGWSAIAAGSAAIGVVTVGWAIPW